MLLLCGLRVGVSSGEALRRRAVAWERGGSGERPHPRALKAQDVRRVGHLRLESRVWYARARRQRRALLERAARAPLAGPAGRELKAYSPVESRAHPNGSPVAEGGT